MREVATRKGCGSCKRKVLVLLGGQQKLCRKDYYDKRNTFSVLSSSTLPFDPELQHGYPRLMRPHIFHTFSTDNTTPDSTTVERFQNLRYFKTSLKVNTI